MAKILTITASNLHLLSSLPPTLKYLDCSGNNLTSLPDLPSTLEYLYCGNNNLMSLPSLPLGLKHLFCRDNNLTSLPSLPPGLTHLSCSNNKLPDWYENDSIEGIHNRQIQEKLLLLRKKIASRLIQKIWTRYWYYPNNEGISRYATYMAKKDLYYM